MMRYYSPSDIAAPAGVHVATVRRWVSLYAAFLSDGANPPKGTPRRFTLDDARVLALVAKMRADNRPDEEIRAALEAGERAPFGEDAPSADETPAAAAPAGTVEAMQREIDRLRQEVDRQIAARIEAERAAGEAHGRYQEARAMVQQLLPAVTRRTVEDATESAETDDAADNAAAENERLRRERDEARRRAAAAEKLAAEREPAPRFRWPFGRK